MNNNNDNNNNKNSEKRRLAQNWFGSARLERIRLDSRTTSIYLKWHGEDFVH